MTSQTQDTGSETMCATTEKLEKVRAMIEQWTETLEAAGWDLDIGHDGEYRLTKDGFTLYGGDELPDEYEPTTGAVPPWERV